MGRACSLHHLIMNTKHMQHVKSHRHTHTKALHPRPKVWLEFVIVHRRLRGMRHYAGFGQFIPLCLNFKVKFLYVIQELSNTTILGYHPVSARLLEWQPLVGSCVLAVSLYPATTSTWPEFSPVEGYNSPKVAAQTIVYATAHYCQVKGKRARRWRNM